MKLWKIIKKEKGKLLFVFAILLSLEAMCQSQIDTVISIRLLDRDKSVVLEQNFRGKADFDFFYHFQKGNGCRQVTLIFDSSNKKVKTFSDLNNFLNNQERKTDSTTLISCFYFDNDDSYYESRLIFCNDNACRHSFMRAVKHEGGFVNGLKKSNIELYRASLHIVLIKEWRCETTPLISTFR